MLGGLTSHIQTVIMMRGFVLVFCVVMTTYWSPVTTAELTPVNPDNLDKAGAHVCVIQKKEPYTVLEAYTAYGTRKTNTWCAALPPRCTEYILTSFTAYRVVTKYRTRDHISCCDGYTPFQFHTYCKPKCEQDCYNNKGHGICAFPNTCICSEGYKGEHCESGCDDGEWGPDCSKSCDCGSHGSCDPSNGNCVCHIGWTGAKCDRKCEGSFGMHCIHPCVCENNSTCDNVNGKCTCQPGYYGAYCHKKCDVTSIDEQTCTQICPCQNGGVCNTDGTCSCRPGYKGDYCSLACDQYHWGIQCKNECKCENGACDQDTGECVCDFGYGGDTCNYRCKEGYFGSLCQNECPCKNGGKCYVSDNLFKEIKCNCTNTGFHGIKCTQRACPDNQWLVNGNCVSCLCPWNTTESCQPYTGKCQCKSGYTGNQCSTECQMPFWGKDCQETCKCLHGDCHYKTGECTQCYHGYRGANCDKLCEQGTYGVNCSSTCQCVNNAYCHEKMGFCNCTAGFKGLTCSKPCEPTEWGKFCTNICTCDKRTSICNPYDGTCQCKSGYYGNKCLSVCPSWKFGYQCRHDCNCDVAGSLSCDHITGDCVCLPEYSGYRCDIAGGAANIVDSQTGSNTETSVGAPLIAVITIACLLLLVLVLMLVLYFRRRIRKLEDENMAVHYNNTDTLPVQTVIPNGNPIHMHNPTYAQENIHNERRYPHLTQKRPLPEPQNHRCSTESFDSIEDEKLRNASTNQRPESSHYQDMDDDRYTTLKSINGATGTTPEVNKNLYVDNYECQMANNHEINQTEETDQGQSPQGHSSDVKGNSSYSNQAYDTEQLDPSSQTQNRSDATHLTTDTNCIASQTQNRSDATHLTTDTNCIQNNSLWVTFSEDTNA